MMERRIRSRCGGLLEVKKVKDSWLDDDAQNTGHTKVVQFMHQSVRDYLLSHGTSSPHDATTITVKGHATLSRACFRYLTFKETFNLASIDVIEMDESKLLQIVPIHNGQNQSLGPRRPGSSRPGSQNTSMAVRVYHLTGPYESKTSRFCEEIVQARVEGRFTDAERESAKWEVHTSSAPELSLFSAIYDEKLGSVDRPSPARVRVVIDPIKHVETVRPGGNDIEIVASLSVVKEGFYRLEMAGANDFSSKDQLTSKEFLPVLAKRRKSTCRHKSLSYIC